MKLHNFQRFKIQRCSKFSSFLRVDTSTLEIVFFNELKAAHRVEVSDITGISPCIWTLSFCYLKMKKDVVMTCMK